ncbi:hypothetical protein [Enterobacter asburiae]|uniref:hypothetical protein n=1 Tax=Enterobacter asburiae TaxID=61645 RepID=UPI0005364929|nr:hypothetical protein [Enterobacter asburiae]AVG34840.1 hypothetical protein MC67_08470 [Enterobacter cloacae complex sp.]
MRSLFKILCWVAGICSFFYLIGLAGESDRKDCEERLAKELNTTAVYINNHCMVKGYGRADGR